MVSVKSMKKRFRAGGSAGSGRRAFRCGGLFQTSSSTAYISSGWATPIVANHGVEVAQLELRARHHHARSLKRRSPIGPRRLPRRLPGLSAQRLVRRRIDLNARLSGTSISPAPRGRRGAGRPRTRPGPDGSGTPPRPSGPPRRWVGDPGGQRSVSLSTISPSASRIANPITGRSMSRRRRTTKRNRVSSPRCRTEVRSPFSDEPRTDDPPSRRVADAHPCVAPRGPG